MQNKKAKVIVSLLVLIGLLGISIIAFANKLDPCAPPEATMHTLNEIYDAVNAASSGIAEREGFVKYARVNIESAVDMLTVVPGKRFVLLKLLCRKANGNQNWTVRAFADEVTYRYIFHGWGKPYDSSHYMWDFPDRCVEVYPGEILRVSNTDAVDWLDVHIIGYFYDVP